MEKICLRPTAPDFNVDVSTLSLGVEVLWLPLKAP